MTGQSPPVTARSRRGVDHDHRRTGRRQAPGARQPDDAGADDGIRVIALGLAGRKTEARERLEKIELPPFRMGIAAGADAGRAAAASVVQTAPGVYRLVLTGKETGTTNAFTITDTLTGGTGPALATSRAADNALLDVNSLSVTSASNTLSDVISGATLSLVKADPATTATVRVTPSGASRTATVFIE